MRLFSSTKKPRQSRRTAGSNKARVSQERRPDNLMSYEGYSGDPLITSDQVVTCADTSDSQKWSWL